jgi:hypothetical protein
VILDCNDQLGCGYFILTRWVDYYTYTNWYQYALPIDGSSPPLLPTCPFPCEVSCEWTEKDGVDYFCYGCNCATDWWRIKYFRQLPTGTVTFEKTDNDPCDLDFLRCVPNAVPGFPEFGKIAHFNRDPRCCGDFTPLITKTCEDCLLPVIFCDGEFLVGNPVLPICFAEPEAWSIEIGECA